HAAIAVGGVDELRHDRDAGDASDRIGGTEQHVAPGGLLGPQTYRLGAQHQVREVHVPGMRGNVGTLGHVAQITQVTVLDHLPVDLAFDAVELQCRGRVDRIEQGRKGLAQAETAPAAVADLEHARQFAFERLAVVERGITPPERMTDGRFEVALAAPARHCSTPARLPSQRNLKLRGSRVPSESGSRASVPPWPVSRTSRRSRQSLLRAPAWPCPDTYQSTRGSRLRSRT